MILNLCICVIVVVIGYNLKNYFSDFTEVEKKWITRLFIYHFIVAILFYFYIESFGGDATKYWEVPKNSTFDEIMYLVKNRKANSFIYLFNYFPANVLQLSFFTGNMIYALLGHLGFIYFIKTFKFYNVDFVQLSNIKVAGMSIFPLIWFLPNLHFWSSGIGKDTLLFFCIALFIYSLLNFRRNMLGLVISILISLAIRPHITMFLFVSFAVAYVLDRNLKIYQKFIILSLFLLGLFLIFDYVLVFIQLESFNTQGIEEFALKKASSLNLDQSGSGIDITQYPFVYKVFTFLYRPLFFDINGPLAVLASVENLILILFSLVIVLNKPIKLILKGNFLIKGLFIYFIIGTIAFSQILGNLGIMLRQKNMLFPVFIIFGLIVLYNHKVKTVY